MLVVTAGSDATTAYLLVLCHLTFATSPSFSFQNGHAPAAELVQIQDQLKDVSPF